MSYLSSLCFLLRWHLLLVNCPLHTLRLLLPSGGGEEECPLVGAAVTAWRLFVVLLQWHLYLLGCHSCIRSPESPAKASVFYKCEQDQIHVSRFLTEPWLSPSGGIPCHTELWIQDYHHHPWAGLHAESVSTHDCRFHVQRGGETCHQVRKWYLSVMYAEMSPRIDQTVSRQWVHTSIAAGSALPCPNVQYRASTIARLRSCLPELLSYVTVFYFVCTCETDT